MGLQPIEVFPLFQCGDRLYTSESDVCGDRLYASESDVYIHQFLTIKSVLALKWLIYLDYFHLPFFDRNYVIKSHLNVNYNTKK